MSALSPMIVCSCSELPIAALWSEEHNQDTHKPKRIDKPVGRCFSVNECEDEF